MKIKFNKKVIIILIVIGVIVIMGILGLGALSFKQINEEKSFVTEDIIEIQVNMTSESVHIIRTEAGSEIKFHYYGKSMQELKLESEINNKTVVLGVKRDQLRPEDMALEIYVPKDYGKNLSIKISSGAVKMDSIDLANFTLNTLSGKLEAEDLKAEKISINSSSGSINIKNSDAKSLEIEDKSGKIMVGCKSFENQNINITASSGRIILQLPSTAEFLLDAKTSAGKIKSDFPINMTGNTDKKKIEGQIGTKNNKVLLQTLSGSIDILIK